MRQPLSTHRHQASLGKARQINMRVIKAFLEEYVQPYEPSSERGNFIAKWVMAIYGFSIFVWLLCLAFRGIYSNEDVFDSIAEIIKVAVVPVATFVIGYCFARECGREGIHFEEVERD